MTDSLRRLPPRTNPQRHADQKHHPPSTIHHHGEMTEPKPYSLALIPKRENPEEYHHPMSSRTVYNIKSTRTTTTTATLLRACTTTFLGFLLLLPIAASMTTTTPSSTSSSSSSDMMRFGKFQIPGPSIFYRTPLSAAFVNLRPIVPGHVLVMPERIVPTMEELNEEEYLDMWKSVRVVQGMLKEHYKATAFNVAVQDGRAAGQSVPHVHVHILPRTAGDFERNDDVYEELEQWAPREGTKKPKTNMEVPDDEDRVDRTNEMMADEAALYRKIIQEKTSKL